MTDLPDEQLLDGEEYRDETEEVPDEDFTDAEIPADNPDDVADDEGAPYGERPDFDDLQDDDQTPEGEPFVDEEEEAV